MSKYAFFKIMSNLNFYMLPLVIFRKHSLYFNMQNNKIFIFLLPNYNIMNFHLLIPEIHFLFLVLENV